MTRSGIALAASAASTRSFTRMRHSLGGTHGLRIDTVSELAPDHSRRRKVDRTAEQLLQLVLDPREAKVADRAVELGDEVHVAVRSCLIPGNGSEHEKRGDPLPPEIVAVRGEEIDRPRCGART